MGAELPKTTTSGRTIPPPTINIDVKDFPLDTLLHIQADMEKKDLLIAHYVGGRISMNARLMPLSELYQNLLDKRGFNRIAIDGTSIAIIGKTCAMPYWQNAEVVIPPNSTALLDQKISINFQSVSVKTLFSIFLEFLFKRGDTFKTDPDFQSLGEEKISIRVKDKPIREIIRAIAISEGYDITVDTENKTFHYKHLQLPTSECNTDQAEKTIYPPAVPHAYSRDREPLENFDLSELSMEGWLHYTFLPNSPSSMRKAIVKTSDKLFYSIGVGSYLGKDFGEVIDIDADGVLIKEQGTFNEPKSFDWMVRRRLIPYREQKILEYTPLSSSGPSAASSRRK